ncbi:MAG: hypothetical protein CME59_01930 [Halioglobus sp.]|nr:hypothetical protein [Halioglobus sp.]|tara:strand:- start:767 stop:1078 length:312 start_codon:yes stop_codon:yes gene_type:complete
MADAAASRRELLRREYLAQTARIPWQDLQTHYARGSVIAVAADLDLVEVAVALGLDDTQAFQDWIASGAVAAVSEAQAGAWFEADRRLWAVVAAPWVLVQARD